MKMATKNNNKHHLKPQMKTVATMVKEAIERNGFKDVKECARSIKVPYDLFNKVVGGHIPKDAQLMDYSKKLNIDSRELILAAYREKAPDEMKQYFNSVLLLEEHNASVREVLELIDSLNADQLEEMLHMARLIRNTPRDYCRKAVALMSLYHELDEDLQDHFDSMVQLMLRNEKLKGLEQFKSAMEYQTNSRKGRRSRLNG